jgi:hypothetical protein
MKTLKSGPATKPRAAAAKRAAPAAGAGAPPAGARVSSAMRAPAREAPAGKSAKRPGRPRYVPSDEHRRIVESMAGFGMDQERISVVIGVSAPTLRRHYRRQLDSALTMAVAQVARSLFRKAVGGDVNAAKFFLSCRAPKEWSERLVVEDRLPDTDPSTLSDAQIANRIAQLRRRTGVVEVAKPPGDGTLH